MSNIRAALASVRAIARPSLVMPHLTVPTFADIPTDLAAALAAQSGQRSRVDIRAVVLDKDNCFALPHSTHVVPEYRARLQQMAEHEFARPGACVIVSNTAGNLGRGPRYTSEHALPLAQRVEQDIGIPNVSVLLHSEQKPFCGAQVFHELRARGIVEHPGHIVCIGDRLFTDILMASSMRAWSIWISEGPAPSQNKVSGHSTGSDSQRQFYSIEHAVHALLLRLGVQPMLPDYAAL